MLNIEAIDGGDFGKKMADDVFKIGAKVRSKSEAKGEYQS